MIKINLIAAISKNNIIGNNGHLPWHIKEDINWFKKITNNSILIMGRKTYLEINRSLPGRYIIVLSKSNLELPKYVEQSKSLDFALSRSSEIVKSKTYTQVFICGGQSVYESTINIATKLYITKINNEYKGDTYFPVINTKVFKLINSQKIKTETNLDINFIEYKRL